jgi:hypothetical protein
MAETYQKARAAEQSITGKRWCSHCQSTRAVEGGQWKVSSNGLHKRWRCQECSQRAKERESAGAGK